MKIKHNAGTKHERQSLAVIVFLKGGKNFRALIPKLPSTSSGFLTVNLI